MMRWSYETVEGQVERNDEDGFTLAFPALPDGAVPVEVETRWDDFTTHQPSGFVLRIQVPDPDGPMACGPNCPVCEGGTLTQPGGADEEAVEPSAARGSEATMERAAGKPAPDVAPEIQALRGIASP